MLLIEKMKEDIFSSSENEIIVYLFKQRENIKDKTTKQISKETYTHPSTLIRIAKKLGYSGWVELKNSFLREIEYLNSHFSSIDANYPFDDQDSIMTVANKMALLNQTTISDTLSLLNHDDLQRATNMLDEAAHIKVFSMYHNLLICHDFKSKMNRIGKHVSLCTVDPHFEAVNSNTETCAIVISYSGESEDIVGLLPFLKRKKVPVIALTSIGENTLTKYADCILRITTREKLYSKIGSFSTNESICFLLDLLYACVFSEDYKNNLEYKIRISKYFDHRKSSNKVMQEVKNDNV
ncbi:MULTISPECIES: MurR/RpiR family transcriptional regulator [Bacillus]|uniref:MurR/RpiR family transcriptional regulator n=1 Tax=Bacillus TaxID=1386 RepID=UPI0007786667|nr:MurR/RpiR family transcriptional regulator [Bacillus toyonensis]KXY48277.1 sugar isomerase [Bacillus cereus]MED3481510.1 MurR/RpiR family transcriptional regulator [Bacillus toyonensis]PEE27759.1 MurR/RpiR family transcriptional regulator [Bacillus toyonensis]PEF79788.1 MurR/RpiR family transcriptional regulator [Bacillus toyonensis]PFY18243.1 MurR/RpiR family transcriptional regulator [Bacillus toyonensis]